MSGGSRHSVARRRGERPCAARGRHRGRACTSSRPHRRRSSARHRCGPRRRPPRTQEASEGRVGVAARSSARKVSKAGFPECRAGASPRLVAIKAAYRCIHLASASQGSCSAARIGGGVRAGVDFATEDGCDEVRALRKVAVNGADADAGLLCDLSHRSVHPGGREHRLGRLGATRRGCAVRRRARADPCGPEAPRHRLWSSGLSLTTTPLDKRNSVPYKYGTRFRLSQVSAARRR